MSTAQHAALTEKLFAFDTGGDVYLVAGDPINGDVLAVMERPNGPNVPVTDEARAIAGELERRWNIHQPLARALHGLRTFIGKPGSNAGEAEIAHADAVLLRLESEPGAEKVLASARERFEFWFRSHPEQQGVPELAFKLGANGEYEWGWMQGAWEAYHAADSGLTTPTERTFASLLKQFFEAYPDIEENEHLSGSDMIDFVTMWMRDARVALERAGFDA